MNNQRLAALKVAQLSKDDKKWLFSQLEDHERQLLSEQIDTLPVMSKNRGQDFSSLLSDVDFEAFEVLAEEDTDTGQTDIDDKPHEHLATLLDEATPQQLASRMDNLSAYMAAVCTVIYPEIGFKYLPQCDTARARNIRACMKKIATPLPPAFKSNVILVLAEALEKIDSEEV